MPHPILEPLISQLPLTAYSRKYIEDDRPYGDVLLQLKNEHKWCCDPLSIDDLNKTGRWHLGQNGYVEWLNDAEENDFIRLVGVLQLIFDTLSAIKEDLDKDD